MTTNLFYEEKIEQLEHRINLIAAQRAAAETARDRAVNEVNTLKAKLAECRDVAEHFTFEDFIATGGTSTAAFFSTARARAIGADVFLAGIRAASARDARTIDTLTAKVEVYTEKIVDLLRHVDALATELAKEYSGGISGAAKVAGIKAEILKGLDEERDRVTVVVVDDVHVGPQFSEEFKAAIARELAREAQA